MNTPESMPWTKCFLKRSAAFPAVAPSPRHVVINAPTPAQHILYGPTRRRIPELWTVDKPMMSGMLGWILIQQSARKVAAKYPKFGPAKEEGLGCGCQGNRCEIKE